MSTMYLYHVMPSCGQLAATVGTLAGKTQRSPTAWTELAVPPTDKR